MAGRGGKVVQARLRSIFVVVSVVLCVGWDVVVGNYMQNAGFVLAERKSKRRMCVCWIDVYDAFDQDNFLNGFYQIVFWYR